MSKTYGPWRLNRDVAILVYDAQEYAIDLEQDWDSGSVLDAIVQVAEKRWATPHVIAHLVHAFNDLCPNGLQGDVCPEGSTHLKVTWNEPAGKLVRTSGAGT
jgi:hypothetical protein